MGYRAKLKGLHITNCQRNREVLTACFALRRSNEAGSLMLSRSASNDGREGCSNGAGIGPLTYLTGSTIPTSFTEIDLKWIYMKILRTLPWSIGSPIMYCAIVPKAGDGASEKVNIIGWCDHKHHSFKVVESWARSNLRRRLVVHNIILSMNP